MNTTIDQWEVLEAVVQLGSFAAAASKMNRSQSTISYAISRLQEQFKIPLLEPPSPILIDFAVSADAKP